MSKKVFGVRGTDLWLQRDSPVYASFACAVALAFDGKAGVPVERLADGGNASGCRESWGIGVGVVAGRSRDVGAVA